MIQYIALFVVAILGVILAVALVEYVIENVFHIPLNLTEQIGDQFVRLVNAVISAISAPFQALAEGVLGISWSPAGYLIMGLVTLAILAIVIYYVAESMMD